MTTEQKHWKRFATVMAAGVVATVMFFVTDKVSFVEWGAFMATNVLGYVIADTTQQIKAAKK